MGFLEGYHLVSKLLHWLMALMILSLLAVGIYMHELPKEDALRPILYMAHKATGMTVLLLVVFRLFWRLQHKPPKLPDVMSNRLKKMANATHASLYVLMFLVPIAGYTMSTAAGYAVNFFDMFELPLLFGKNKMLAELAGGAHVVLAFVMLTVIVLHVIGAVKHRLSEE